MVRFIDDHRDVYGVELMCAAAPIALSSYFLHKAQYADPTQRSARAWVTTTQAVPDAGRLPDLVARDFTATGVERRRVSRWSPNSPERGRSPWRRLVCIALLTRTRSRVGDFTAGLPDNGTARC